MIARRASTSRVGARGFDCITRMTKDHARSLHAAGMDFAVRYLGGTSSAELDEILASGLAFMPVTYGGAFDGPATVSHLIGLGVPTGTTVWLDLEGQDERNGVAALLGKINAWAKVVGAAYDPGLYVGAGALLTSAELYALPVDRYWHSLSRVTDRHGALAEPPCGWAMHQLFPTVTIAGVPVDVNFIQEDYRKRLPTWVVAG